MMKSSQELDSMIVVGPFLLRCCMILRSCDSLPLQEHSYQICVHIHGNMD